MDYKDPTSAPQYGFETARIERRRRALADGEREHAPRWALALSGGGIRSATFGLGVLQALARAPSPVTERKNPLLADFDYLSTVSGGGYIGSFLSSLFLPDRLRASDPPQTPEQASEAARAAALDAYAVLRYEPPGRISTSNDYAENVGKGPTAWLRENGRYLTPTGSGDTAYAVAMTWRNWLSLHFVVGMPVLLMVALLFLVQSMLLANLFLLPALVFLFGVLPAALAYWLVLPGDSLDSPASLENAAARFIHAGMYALILLAAVLCLSAATALAALVSLLLASVMCLAQMLAQRWVDRLARKPADTGEDDAVQGQCNSVRKYRVVITWCLSKALLVFVLALFLALIGILAQEIYLRFAAAGTTGTFALLPALIWLVRKLALIKDEKSLPSWFARLPLDVLGLIGGAILALVLCLAWSLATLWIASAGGTTLSGTGFNLAVTLLAAIAATVMWLNSRFVGFLNTSTLQPFYAARLTRAYLGASNRQRFDGTTEQRRKRMSVAEPLAGDDLTLDAFYGPTSAGPLHLVNVTLNLTVDPSEQLVQRDRKGKPLCIGPGSPDAGPGECASFILDGRRYERGKAQDESEINQSLTLGQWIGVSGAAVSTGLGRTTSLGLSLLLGLANVRLGIWWPGRLIDPGSGQWLPGDRGVASWLPTQTYLYYELTSKFHGHRRDYQYLSDGGHFENTAAYELVRPERQVELIVLCDCGCDADYRFDDLSNLVRLARIDHAVEISEDLGVLRDPVLSRVFGRLRDFANPPSAYDNRCAVLLDVKPCCNGTDSIAEQTRKPCRILLIKPRLIATLAPDVQNYARNNADFPNQTTADQFFDEAQFESYRQLGLDIGTLLFGTQGTTPNATQQALWSYLNTPPRA